MIKDIIVDRSVPSYIASEYPYFKSFIDAYYEWLSQQTYPIDNVINLKKYRDIDTTLDEFIDYFQYEYVNKFPSNLLADKKLLIKHIKDFYLNKGNQSSYKFLFRVLYNEDISFYFPGDDILKASDGKWQEDKILKISITDINITSSFENFIVTGKTSGAVAGIESALSYIERGELVCEIFINTQSGSFIPGESVIINGAEYSTFNVYSTATVVDQGSGYMVGDIIPIKNEFSEILGSATVSRTTKGPVTGFNIIEAGEGYNGNEQLITSFYALPVNYTWDSIYLPDSPVYGGTYDFSVEAVNFAISTETISGIGDPIDIRDISTSSGYGAYGVVEQVGNDGEILTATVVEQGDLYEAPTATIDSTTGSGAVLGVIGGGGGVDRLKVNSFPIYLPTDTTNINLDFTVEGDGNATGTLNTSITATYPGRWINEDGQLSSSKKLQDNYYYQDYSYVIKVSKSINEWREYIKNIIHPLGMSLFGQIDIVSIPDTIITTEYSQRIITMINDSMVNTTPTSIIKLYSIDTNGDLIPILDTNGNHLIDF